MLHLASRSRPSEAGRNGGPVVTVGSAPAAKGAASVQTLPDTDAIGPLGRAGY